MTDLPLSDRVGRLKPSATIAVARKAQELALSGAPVISFSLGEPDFATPERIRRAAVEALAAGQTHYMPTLGDRETRQAIANKLARENGISGLTWEHIAISSGAKHSLYLACQCLLSPGDEALLPVPSWVSYAPIIELAGGKVVAVPTGPAAGFRVSADQLRAAITPRTRLLVINSPSNPCGTMYREVELRSIAAVVADAARALPPGPVILTDEIYEKLVYGPGGAHFSIGSLPEVRERTVTLNGLSKAFAMTGWRIGYAACPGESGRTLIRAFETLQGQMTNNITSFLYPAVRTAMNDCADEVESMRRAFEARARRMHDRLARIPGMACPPAEGAFYFFPQVAGYFGRRTPGGVVIRSAMDFAAALLAERHVAVVPGEDFGGCGGRHVRLSFACAEPQIDEGLDRLAAFVASLT